MILTKLPPFEIRDKRFGVDLHSTCPKCGARVEESYLSFPTANKPFEVDWLHEECPNFDTPYTAVNAHFGGYSEWTEWRLIEVKISNPLPSPTEPSTCSD